MILRVLAAATLLLVTGCGRSSLSTTKEAWNDPNNPMKFSSSYERHLASLPLAGELTKTPWSDTYWPSYEGGLANRWHAAQSDGFSYTPKTADEVSALSLADLAQLSPAEKYDILVGDFSYPLLSYERGRTNPSKPTWEGICHGWSPASLVFDEPNPVLFESASGVKIPFGASDVKALLSLYEGNLSSAKSTMVGTRCNVDLTEHPELANSDECRDVNAGAFHLVVANQLGILKQGFVADVTRDVQVWNQPVHGFKSTILGTQAPSSGAAPGTVSERIIRTEMTYSVEVMPSWAPSNGTPHHADNFKVYNYRVELDESGAIIGGEWLDDERPDFLWTKDRAAFSGYFEELGKLYDQSIASPAYPDPVHGV